MKPSEEELKKQQRERDSIAAIQFKRDSILQIQRQQQQAIAEEEAEQIKASTTIPEEQVQDTALNWDKYGVFSGASQGENTFFTIENSLSKFTLSTKGGRIYSVILKDYVTYDSLPLVIIDSDSTLFGLEFFSNNRRVFTNDFYFIPYINGQPAQGQQDLVVPEGETIQLAMRLYTFGQDGNPNQGQYIEYVYVIQYDDYMIDFDINIVGMRDVIAATGNLIDLTWEINTRRQEKSVDRFNAPTVYYKFSNGEVDYLAEGKDDEESLTDKLKWVSFKQHFFSATILADDHFVNPVMRTYTNPMPSSDRYLKTMSAVIGIPYQGMDEEHNSYRFFFGPNKYQVVRAYGEDLERQIPLGWSFFLMQWINRYAVIPVFDFLGTLGWNYGIIILILTILLKLVLFPITYRTYKSQAKMRALKPEVDEITKKFPKKEDAMKKQQATMALYKKAGVNPMAGCIPMLLQMPILLAMFRFFPSSIELRQQSFLWATDLSSYDSILDLPFEIPFYGDHVSLFTLLMTASTIIYTRINNQMMASGSQQMPGMKTMMYLMPVMFLGIFNNYASALSYYYLLANLITFGQMFLIRRSIDEEKIYKKLQENKKKPTKKSGFQKRLEDAAKKRGYQSKK